MFRPQNRGAYQVPIAGTTSTNTAVHTIMRNAYLVRKLRTTSVIMAFVCSAAVQALQVGTPMLCGIYSLLRRNDEKQLSPHFICDLRHVPGTCVALNRAVDSHFWPHGGWCPCWPAKSPPRARRVTSRRPRRLAPLLILEVRNTGAKQIRQKRFRCNIHGAMISNMVQQKATTTKMQSDNKKRTREDRMDGEVTNLKTPSKIETDRPT